MKSFFSKMRQKTPTGEWIDAILSPELRFCRPLRKSNNHNLEEQLLIGPSRIVTCREGIEDGKPYQEEIIEFREESDTSGVGYYKLVTRHYGEASSDVFIEGKVLNFEGTNLVEVQGDTTLVDLQGDNFMVYEEDPMTHKGVLTIASTMIVQESTLSFVKEDGTGEWVICKKTTTQENRGDNSVIVKESITNIGTEILYN